MELLDYGYLFIVVAFVIIGIVILWNMANKRRNDSIRNYLGEKEQRLSRFNN